MTADAAQRGEHARAGSEYPHAFGIVLTIGGAARLPAAVATDRAGQDQLREMWHVRCG